MFTGIIEHVGTIAAKRDDGLSAEAPGLAQRLSVGGSIAVAGVCLTATRIAGDIVDVDVVPETFARTTLARCVVGTPVNLELPATPSTFLAGHIVQGHVDGVGEVREVTEEGNSVRITLAPERELMRYVVEKGSVAVDGVSLTVAGVSDDAFMVAVIPHTRTATTLGLLQAGGRVNIETDVLAKYAEKLILH
jgi:riboflavin synthase